LQNYFSLNGDGLAYISKDAFFFIHANVFWKTLM